ncbi:MAG TPA: alpha/beta hydrolase [Smithella sp.]|nr:alpha/beta hydrolase [Smithella sp.]
MQNTENHSHKMDKQCAAVCGLYGEAYSWFIATIEEPERLTRLAMQMCRSDSRKIILCINLLIFVLFSGCATLPDVKTENVNNHRVEYSLIRSGSATVVFENGLDGKMNWWRRVIPDISKDATTFAYNRPGYGNSDGVSSLRDGLHIVEELRTLLKSNGLTPPYVLVGHSYGGLLMQLFARKYPDEVSALILVDSTHPEQFKGKGARKNWPAWLRFLFHLYLSSAARQEMDFISATGEQVLTLPAFSGKPVIVLSALQPLSEKGELADDANAKRKDIARLYPGSQQVWVDSGHGIPLEKPEAVIDAVRQVLSKKIN